MTLQELYESLSLGVLSNLIEGDEGSGFVQYPHQAKVTLAVNQALTALHGKFILKVQEVQIRAYDNMTIYPLQQKYADQDSTTVPQKFISDSAEAPFLGDVLRVMEIYDEVGTQLSFDEPGAKIFMPNPTTVQIVEPAEGNTYFIIYQARHEKLDPAVLEAEVVLPDVLIPALEAYVAHLILSPKNGQEHAAKSAEYYAKYEMVCAEVEDKDLVSSSVAQATMKLCDRGFK